VVALQQQHPFVQQFFSQAFPFFGAHWHSVVTTPTDDAPKHRLSKNEKNFENLIAPKRTPFQPQYVRAKTYRSTAKPETSPTPNRSPMSRNSYNLSPRLSILFDTFLNRAEQ
jgi:hypothetical protein